MSLMRAHLKNKVSWIRKNGERQDDIPALVQKDTIFMDNLSLEMEEGDTLVRVLPNGKEEIYTITYLDYIEGLRGKIDHIEISVRKESAIYDDKTPNTVNYHQYGKADQVNINSPNASLQYNTNQGDIFTQMRKIVTEDNTIDTDTKQDLLNKVDGLEKAKEKEGFRKIYDDFVTSAAKHATLCTGIITITSKIMEYAENLK